MTLGIHREVWVMTESTVPLLHKILYHSIHFICVTLSQIADSFIFNGAVFIELSSIYWASRSDDQKLSILGKNHAAA